MPDRDAIGGGEIVGFAEYDGETEGNNHKQPIDATNVANLAVACGRSLSNLESRQPTQLYRLAGH